MPIEKNWQYENGSFWPCNLQIQKAAFAQELEVDPALMCFCCARKMGWTPILPSSSLNSLKSLLPIESIDAHRLWPVVCELSQFFECRASSRCVPHLISNRNHISVSNWCLPMGPSYRMNFPGAHEMVRHLKPHAEVAVLLWQAQLLRKGEKRKNVIGGSEGDVDVYLSVDPSVYLLYPCISCTCMHKPCWCQWPIQLEWSFVYASTV